MSGSKVSSRCGTSRTSRDEFVPGKPRFSTSSFGAATRAFQSALELLRIGLLLPALEPEPVGVGVAEAEDAQVAR